MKSSYENIILYKINGEYVLEDVETQQCLHMSKETSNALQSLIATAIEEDKKDWEEYCNEMREYEEQMRYRY